MESKKQELHEPDSSDKKSNNSVETPGKPEKQLVTFNLHEQLFGIDIQYSAEIQRRVELTKVFHTPDFVRGVINIRGEILVIFDIGLFFDMQKTEFDQSKKIIVVNWKDDEAGIIADSMEKVMTVDAGRINSPPPSIANVSSEWVEGVVPLNGKPLVILDVPAIFESKRIQNL